jgi:hypothetical protein
LRFRQERKRFSRRRTEALETCLCESRFARSRRALCRWLGTGSVADTDPDTYSDGDANCDPDANTYAYTNTYADTDPDTYSDGDANCDPDANTYTNTYADGDANCDPDANTYTNTYADTKSTATNTTSNTKCTATNTTSNPYTLLKSHI